MNNRFDGRELQTRTSRLERQYYLNKLRDLAARGDQTAMAELVKLDMDEIRNWKKQLMKEYFMIDRECRGALSPMNVNEDRSHWKEDR